MIAWWWLIPAVMVGAFYGIFIAAVLHSAGRRDGE